MEPTRREFLKTSLIAGTTMAALPRLALAATSADPARVPLADPTALAPESSGPAPFTRGIGVYPGAPGEFFGPTLLPDTTGTYRNLALLRPAFASSSYDYNLTPQLITDGLTETRLPDWIVSVANGQILPKYEREILVHHSPEGILELSGAEPSVELHLGGGVTPPEIDRVQLFVVVPANIPPAALRFTVSVSEDGYLWHKAGTGTGSHPLPPENYPPDMVRGANVLAPSIPLDQPRQSRFYRVDFALGDGTTPSASYISWHLGQVEFYRGRDRINLGGPYSFTSAWKSLGMDQEWVYVDLGGRFSFDNIKLHWIARPAEGRLQTSDDAHTWHDLQPLPAPQGPDSPTDDIRVPGEARYVRVLMTRPATAHGYILSELEVFGHGGFTIKPHTPAAPQDGRLNLAGGNWRLQRAPQVQGQGEALSTPGFHDTDWITATVPGTTLTSFLNIGAIPDPNFGQNQLAISDSFFYADFWYRTEFTPPPTKPGEVTMLNLDGINWKAEIFLNGAQLGRIDGGFMRGRFDLTGKLQPGKPNALAIRILKNATPGSCKQKTYESTGKNGGGLGADNPTFHASIGWDWIPTIRGRNTGIWSDVYLTTTGPVTLEDPLVTSTLPTAGATSTLPAPGVPSTLPTAAVASPPAAPGVPSTLPTAAVASPPAAPGVAAGFSPLNRDTSHPGGFSPGAPAHADLTLELFATNHTAKPFTGTLHVRFGDLALEHRLTLAPNERKPLKLTPETHHQLRIANPQLWWPTGYGDPHLYNVDLRLETAHGEVSDRKSFKAGIRQMTSTEDGGKLRLFINGRRFIPKGGNWGFGESMLRYRAREYDAAVRYHREMNFNMIRDWVGQIGDEPFYEACDRHGIVVWQDFWLANPWDGPIPEDNAMFLANARDYIARIRNHPSVAFYCGRNEWFPPAPLDKGIRALLAELHPGIPYIGSSADGPVSGHGPYRALSTPEYFRLADPKLHSEIGAPAIPPLESVRAMMPERAIWPQGLDWGLHDFTLQGAQGGEAFLTLVNEAYGGATNGPDWIKLGEILSYEAYRAMFEAQSVHRMGLLLWMSHPCWPSFVWQTYDFYLQPTASYFACKLASEPLHIQWNPLAETIEVVNYSAGNQANLTAQVEVLNLDGSTVGKQSAPIPTCTEDSTTTALPLQYPARLSALHFLRLTLSDSTGKPVSTNFYLRGRTQGDYTALRTLPRATVRVTTTSARRGDRWLLTSTLQNTSPTPALFLRLQAIRETTRDRIVPAIYSDGYLALMPNETRTLTTELNHSDTRGEQPRITLEGFNLTPAPDRTL